MKLRNVFLGLVAMLPLALLPTPAQADVPRIPLRCGLVVREDAYVYLERNLYCPGPTGVTAGYNGEEQTVPRVTVDLQGHTLRGSGTGGGVTASAYPESVYLTIINGRVENWDMGVGGDSDTRIKNVKLVDNRIAFWCNGYCEADSSYFKNSSTAFIVGGEAHALIARSWFSRNRTGVSIIGFVSSAEVQRNTFKKNGTAVYIACSSFGTLTRNRFIKNGTNIYQQPCE